MTDHRSGIPGQWSALFWFRLGSLIPRILRRLFQSSFDCILQLCWFNSRLKPFQNLSIPADQEFREIPFDFSLLLAFQEGIKGAFILPVDLKLGKPRELCVIVLLAEVVDFSVIPRRFVQKLIAGEIQNLKSLVPIGLIELLKPFLLRGIAALGRRVYDQKDLSLVFFQRCLLIVQIKNRNVVDRWFFSENNCSAGNVEAECHYCGKKQRQQCFFCFHHFPPFSVNAF